MELMERELRSLQGFSKTSQYPFIYQTDYTQEVRGGVLGGVCLLVIVASSRQSGWGDLTPPCEDRSL